MRSTYLSFEFLNHDWWLALKGLVAALDRSEAVNFVDADAATGPEADIAAAYRRLAGAIASARQPDLATLVASALLDHPVPFGLGADGSPAPGVVRLLRHDVAMFSSFVSRDLGAEVRAQGLVDAPELTGLAFTAGDDDRRTVLAGLAELLARGDADGALDTFLAVVRERGSGPAALNRALRYSDGELVAVSAPGGASLAELVGLDEQLARLVANTEALLDRRPAHNTLLYGPRGSGKSTAVRGLIERFGGDGLRLVELPVDELHHLARLLDGLRALPQSFVLFVDDLGFDDGDPGYRPLRTLLEGGLSGRPNNVALYATSNRRHLVKERFSDRPDPLNDDVHGWDTQHEKLALSDRFGLTLTFPDAGQRRYLELVSALAAARALQVDDLEQRAIRFAEWGNGYSGRTARQFIDTLLQTHGVAGERG